MFGGLGDDPVGAFDEHCMRSKIMIKPIVGCGHVSRGRWAARAVVRADGRSDVGANASRPSAGGLRGVEGGECAEQLGEQPHPRLGPVHSLWKTSRR